MDRWGRILGKKSLDKIKDDPKIEILFNARHSSTLDA